MFRRANSSTPSATTVGNGPSRVSADPAAIQQQLERLLNSPHFRASRRCAGFLQFATDQVCKGNAEALKERLIGVEVFGRSPDYDTNSDPIVRSTAGEVRKRLAQYYLEPGHESELRIDLPSGGYVPQFPPAPEAPAAPRRRFHFRVAVRGLGRKSAIAVAVLTLLAGSAWILARPQQVDPLDQFWEPVLNSQGPVLVSMGQPTAFNFSAPVQAEVERRIKAAQTNQDLGGYKIDLKDVTRFTDRYVTIYDAICLSNITALLVHKGKPYHVRGGNSTSFTDLREHAAVLIGGWDNQWTLDLAGASRLRYVFETDRPGQTEIVRDRQNPGRRDWVFPSTWPQWKVSSDYAIVSRLIDPSTDKTVIMAAGLTHFGTHAAGEFVTNSEYFQEALRGAPRNWSRMNMQVVLQTSVVEDGPGRPRVLATYFW